MFSSQKAPNISPLCASNVVYAGSILEKKMSFDVISLY